MDTVFVDTDFKRGGQPIFALAACEPRRWISVTGLYNSQMARDDWEEDVQYRDGVHYDLNAVKLWVNAPYGREDIQNLMEVWHREKRPDSWRERFKGVKGGLAMVEARAKYGEDARRIRDQIYDAHRLPDEELEARHLALVRAYVPEHYKKNEGKLLMWGEIKRYRYFTYGEPIILDPDGNILSDVELGPIGVATLRV